LFFSSNDSCPRAVPFTLALEHWKDDILKELSVSFKSMCSAVCLDRKDSGEVRELTRDQAIAMVSVLKSERTKLMDHNKIALEKEKESARRDISLLTDALKDAEKRGDNRVEVRAAECNIIEKTSLRKCDAFDELNKKLTQQVACLSSSEKHSKSRIACIELEHGQEKKEAENMRKALESQVSNLQSSHAKQVSELARARKETEKVHDASIKESNSKIEHYKKKANAMKTAAEAVSKSADEARRKCAESNLALRSALTENVSVNSEICGMKSQLDELAAAKLEISQLRETIDMHDTSLQDALKDHKNVTNELEAEIVRVKSLLVDAEKRAKASELRIKEVESRTKEVDCETKKWRRGQNGVRKSQDSREVASVIVPTAPAVSIAPPPPPPPPPTPPPQYQYQQQHQHHHQHQQHGFPPNFEVDPVLEGVISQLHTALQVISATARSARSSNRSADMCRAKLDALGSVGYFNTVPQPHYLPHS
jgi:chromosome segregation ATPase